MSINVDPAVGVTDAVTLGTEPSRTPLIAVIGDPLPCLAALAAAPEVEHFPGVDAVTGNPRAVVIGIDIRALRTRRHLRSALRDIEDQCATLCARLRGLEHIVLVLNGSPVVSESSVLRICDSAARRVHTRLEQSYARSLVITAVLAERCNDRDRLAERVITRARERESLDAGIALRWQEIAHTSIGAAGMNEYL